MQLEARTHNDTDGLLPHAAKRGRDADACKKRKCNWITLSVLAFILIVIVFVLLFVFDAINWFGQSSTTTTGNGLFGKFPCYGGNAMNQQIAASQTDAILNTANIHNLTTLCVYDSLSKALPAFQRGVPSSGYTTIDDGNRAYIADSSGYASCIDLDSCQPIWETNVAKVLGYNESVTQLSMRHTATLFTNSKGQKGIIFGAPNARNNFPAATVGYDDFDPCWAVALSIDDGSLLWATILGGGYENFQCMAHGFMVDENDHFAYGGMSTPARRDWNTTFGHCYRGKMFKLDLDDGSIVHKWYSIDAQLFNCSQADINVDHMYRGGSMWNMPAIVDDYLVFGTGNLFTYPKYIEHCLLGNYSALPMERANPIDPCGSNRSLDNKWWRCLEKGVYPDSFVVLNKHTFEPLSITPLQGVDTESFACRDGRNEIDPHCMKVQGPDADLAAVAAYRNRVDEKLYAAAIQKSGHFYVFEVPSGNVVIAKKISPWTTSGGGQWSMAVDAANMIGIVTITGGRDYPKPFKYTLMNGSVLCGRTGSTHAIDLNTGSTIWQMVNPWGTIDDCDDAIYDEYVDITLNATCQRDVNGDAFVYPPLIDDNVNVVMPPVNESERGHIRENGQRLISPVTVVGDMVFIPAWSGDIFVHNLWNGSFIHSFTSPQRYVMKGGVSVVGDRAVFQSGDSAEAVLVSMKLSV